MSGRASLKLRTFFVGDRLFDVEMSLPLVCDDGTEEGEARVTYTVDWSASSKMVFQAPRPGMHFECLLAALDKLEQFGELDEELATTPSSLICEV